MAKETVTTLVIASLDQDQQDYRETGFRPISFEVEAAGVLRDPEATIQPVRVHGRWDRVDRRTSDGGMRVIDYKLKQSRAMKGEDRDLVTAAIRGFRLQPPLYALMELDGLRPQRVELRFLAPGWTRTVERAEFDAKAWGGAAGRQLQQSMRMLLDGVQAGRFFMLPDPRSSRGEAGYCDFCSYAAACRRFHGPSWWRAFSAEPARALRLLRKQKAARDDAAGGP
jgi:ATP-dependent helicase/nuclease subunit B